MFLFLSKLLPLFIYPLGLSCLLTIVGLILLWRRNSRGAAGAIMMALFVILVASNGWFSQWLVRSLEGQNLPAAELPQAEAIVVLGGGIKPAIPPRPNVDVSEAGDRIIYGAELFRKGKAPWLILSGGRIDWKDGGPPESEDMASLAEIMGVPKSAILQDPTSLNTHQNAVEVRKILERKGIKGPVLLVTSAMHTPRSLLVFKRQGINVIAAPTDFLVTENNNLEEGTTWEATLLNLLPNAYSLQQSTKALKEYIGLVVYRLRGWI
ncbi:MAG: YdcF family protein [Okeania sp. SIO2H7]|nr:YdcF family protein [Okeania sp. SIO2H7]